MSRSSVLPTTATIYGQVAAPPLVEPTHDLLKTISEALASEPALGLTGRA